MNMHMNTNIVGDLLARVFDGIWVLQDYELIPFACFFLVIPHCISLPDATDEAGWASWFSPATTLADAREVLPFPFSFSMDLHGLRMMCLGLENLHCRDSGRE